MVIRAEKGHWLLVSQPAHAWISGQIAENWGTEEFITPDPWKELCFAAGNHDAGWLNHDRYPRINPGTGLPYDYMTIPVGDHIKIWSESAEQVVDYSRFAALLVSRHIMGLCSMHDFRDEPKQLKNAEAQFKKQQQSLQNRLIKDLGRDSFYKPWLHAKNLENHRRLLSVFDYLSLLLIEGTSTDLVLNNIPLRIRSSPIRLALTAKEPETYTVTPWPFKTARVELRCDALRLKTRCTSQQELDQAIKQCDRVLYSTQLIPST